MSKVTGERPYHHGRLREVVLEAAVEEIGAVGTARMSMREIAKRAGVSHAAPAHHFGDKAGIFTAIAIEGFRLLRAETTEAATGQSALLQSGIAYLNFAIAHPEHFEVMFQPDLYRCDDPEVTVARDEAFDVLFGAVAGALGPGHDEMILPTSVVAWSVMHGFATLWLTGNLQDRIGADASIDTLTPEFSRAFVTLGQIIGRQLPPGV
jgi:AcrR family transcriptional regulator